MKDEATKFGVPVSGQVSQRLLRTGWASIVATVAAGGLLFTASVNVPPAQRPDADRAPSLRNEGPVTSEAAVPVRTVPADVSPQQIVAVLERAADLAREQGPDLSPTVAQAAAELGMLYATYTRQQATSVETNGGLRLQDTPVARDSEKRRRTPDDADSPAPVQEVLSAVPVSYEHAPAGDSSVATDEPDATAAAGTVGPETGYVTYDQVVIAAVRLATMLDLSLPDASVEVQRTDRPQGSSLLAGSRGLRERQGSSLRANLLDVVTTFGGSTRGYANGRIPAAVLCPLKFAPGHLLRCDAAERLTALSDRFDREFGYPIPITDSYRTYVEQIALAGAKPHLAAVPGTSNHGWGLAVDLSSPISGGTSREYAWLRVHGPRYGWDNPSWARPDGSKPEPWHFEFFAAGAIPDRALDPADVGSWASNLPAASAEGAGEAAPRSTPALDPTPRKTRPAEPPRTPAEPKDEPSTSPPAQRPTKPAPQPKPSEPAPKPTPKPTPEPTPTTPPSSPPSPSPSPSPSEPGQETSTPTPSPTPPPAEPSDPPSAPPPSTPPPTSPGPVPAPSPDGDGETRPAPTSSPSASVPSGPPAEPTDDLGETADGINAG